MKLQLEVNYVIVYCISNISITQRIVIHSSEEEETLHLPHPPNKSDSHFLMSAILSPLPCGSRLGVSIKLIKQSVL